MSEYANLLRSKKSKYTVDFSIGLSTVNIKVFSISREEAENTIKILFPQAIEVNARFCLSNDETPYTKLARHVSSRFESVSAEIRRLRSLLEP